MKTIQELAEQYYQEFETVQARQSILSLQNIENVDIVVSVPESRIASISPENYRTGTPRHTNFVAKFDYFPAGISARGHIGRRSKGV